MRDRAMAETDPYEHDPFFKKIQDADWNACRGRRLNSDGCRWLSV
jgi:hypothetical protein